MIRGQLSSCFRPLSKVLRTSRKWVGNSRLLPTADIYGLLSWETGKTDLRQAIGHCLEGFLPPSYHSATDGEKEGMAEAKRAWLVEIHDE
mgnify:CR=1 FL=1